MAHEYLKRSRIARSINTVTAVFLATILMVMIANAALTRHPWAITCYNCKACNLTCPLGLDPSGYVTAALTANPDYMMYATKLRISLEEALQVDPGMIINHRGKQLSAQRALSELGLSPKTEVRVYKMRAKDAAQYDLLCGNCQKTCPINLPIEEIIRDLRKNGRFESLKGSGKTS